MSIRKRAIVSGIVQGVGFRYSAVAEAERLGVAGWVRNRADGSVEAEVEGEPEAVGRMLDWLRRGTARRSGRRRGDRGRDARR